MVAGRRRARTVEAKVPPLLDRLDECKQVLVVNLEDAFERTDSLVPPQLQALFGIKRPPHLIRLGLEPFFVVMLASHQAQPLAHQVVEIWKPEAHQDVESSGDPLHERDDEG